GSDGSAFLGISWGGGCAGVVGRTADVFVDLGQAEGDMFGEGDLIETALEDRPDGAVGERVDPQCPVARGLEAARAVAVAESEDAEAGAVALLGVGLALEHTLDEFASAGPRLAGPRDDPGRRPLEMPLMRLRSVRRLGREPALACTARVHGDP